jgi:hypothetical protein
MNNNSKKTTRKSNREVKKYNKKVKKHAKWAGLDMNDPKDASTAKKTYDSLTGLSMKKGGKVPKSNYNGWDIQPS